MDPHVVGCQKVLTDPLLPAQLNFIKFLTIFLGR